MDIEQRLKKLERKQTVEERIGGFERIGVRVGMLVIALLTLLLIIITKCSEVLHAIKVALDSV